MADGLEATEADRNEGEDHECLDEAQRAIARTRNRIDAQQRRIARLKMNGLDSQTAEMMLAKMRDSLEELHILRLIVMRAIAYRKVEPRSIEG